jgi:hypothetical protein
MCGLESRLRFGHGAGQSDEPKFTEQETGNIEFPEMDLPNSSEYFV